MEARGGSACLRLGWKEHTVEMASLRKSVSSWMVRKNWDKRAVGRKAYMEKAPWSKSKVSKNTNNLYCLRVKKI